MTIILFDTETDGLPKRFGAPISDVNNYPRVVQLGYMVYEGDTLEFQTEHIVKPEGFYIPRQASDIHGITQKIAMEKGESLSYVLDEFKYWLEQADTLIGHNVEFDYCVMASEYWRRDGKNPLEGKTQKCTMKASTNFVGIPSKSKFSSFKYPKLSELYEKLFNAPMGNAHTALQDIQNTRKCYTELVRLGVMK